MWAPQAQEVQPLACIICFDLFIADRKNYDQEGEAHFLTFSCFRRRKLLNDDTHKKIVVGMLNSQLTLLEGECFGFVGMPDRVE